MFVLVFYTCAFVQMPFLLFCQYFILWSFLFISNQHDLIIKFTSGFTDLFIEYLFNYLVFKIHILFLSLAIKHFFV